MIVCRRYVYGIKYVLDVQMITKMKLKLYFLRAQVPSQEKTYHTNYLIFQIIIQKVAVRYIHMYYRCGITRLVALMICSHTSIKIYVSFPFFTFYTTAISFTYNNCYFLRRNSTSQKTVWKLTVAAEVVVVVVEAAPGKNKELAIPLVLAYN